MGKIKKNTEGVFTTIIGSSVEVPAYEQFIQMGEELDTSKELKRLGDSYRKLINENKDTFRKLALLEELIMQMRAKENISEIKLSLVREYVYARCTFFRKDRDVKDIRVILGNAEFLTPALRPILKQKTLSAHDKKFVTAALDGLLQDNAFVESTKAKIREAMDEEIAETHQQYKGMAYA
jgi:hypothetical protein